MDQASENHLKARIREARGKFAAMAGTYCLGVFNDNFFKQAAMLVALYIAKDESLQNIAAVVFTLPWLLCAAPAGWMADRFPKRTVVISAKALELAAMICGGLGIILVNWPLIMVMMFVMALQSTIFSPALNGSIPELYPAQYVVKANARLKMLIMVGNLVGIILAGLLLSRRTPVWWGVWLGQVLVGFGVVGIAVVGLAASFGCARKPAADPTVRFPWSGPWSTLKELWRIYRGDRLLTIIIVGDAFVWFVAVLQILIINKIGQEVLGFTPEGTSYLLLPELIGVGVGGLLAGRIATGDRWYRVLTPSMFMLAVFALLVAATPIVAETWRIPWIVGMLFAAGVAGGVLLIPMESFFQVRPRPERKGAVIAAANFAGFLGMSISGVVNEIMKGAELYPTSRFLVVGGLSVIAGVWLLAALRKEQRG